MRARAERALATSWVLVAAVAILVCGPVILAGELAAQDSQDRYHRAAIAATADTARGAASEIEARIDSVKREIERVGALDLGPAIRAGDLEAIHSRTALLLNPGTRAPMPPEIGNLWISDGAGRPIGIWGHDVFVILRDFSGQSDVIRRSVLVPPDVGSSDFFAIAKRQIAALDRRPFVTRNVRFDPPFSAVGPLVVAPIRDGLELAGVIVAQLKTGELARPLAGRLASVDELLLYDDAGRLVAQGSDPQPTYVDLSASPVVQTSLAGGVVRGDAEDPRGGGRRIVAVANVTGTGWRVAGVLAKSRAESDLADSLAQQRSVRLALIALLLLGTVVLARTVSEVARRRQALAEALERQTAVSEVLKIVSRSPIQLDNVFEAVVASAVQLCRADNGGIVRIENGRTYVAAHAGTQHDAAAIDEYWSNHTIAADRSSLTGRVLLERRSVAIADIYTEPDFVVRDLPGQDPRPNHSMLGVPLLHGSEVLGVVILRRREIRPFSEGDIALAETFADQAVIAIENVRLFNETNEALGQQTALSDVLRTISRSAFDLDAVLQTIVERAAVLVGAEAAAITRRDGDEAVVLAQFGSMLPASQRPGTRIPVVQRTAIGRAILTRKRQYIADAAEDPDLSQSGPRTRLVIPFLRDGTAIGTLGVMHNLPKPFSDRELQMLETFADQAAIAIENVRLFNETREGLERQTALGEVLRATAASPSNIQPVLDAVAANAARLLDADDVLIARLDGADVVMAAHIGEVPVLGAGVRAALDPGMVSHRAILEARAIHVPDLLATGDFPKATELARETGQRTSLAVPLLREGTPIGAILIRRTEVRPFTEAQVQLLKAFADQAAIAIENVRLFNETKEALAQQTAIAGVLSAINSSRFDQGPVLDTVVERAAELCEAQWAAIAIWDGSAYVTVAWWGPGMPVDYVSLMADERQLPTRKHLIGRVALLRETVHIEDVLADPEYSYPVLQEAAGYRTALGIPLLRDGFVVGVFALTRNQVKPFTPRQIALVETFAQQAVIAIENVRLFNETKEALEQQTAVGEVLKTISRSAFDLQPVLDIVLNNAVRLAGADIGWLSRVENDQFTTVAYSTEFPQAVKDELVRQRAQGHIAGPWIPLGTGGGLMGFTLAEGRTVHLPDVKEDAELKGSIVARLTDSRTVVGVPMLRDGRSIGGMVLARYAVRPFSEREIELVQTFADQAAIAIENVRLFNETKEALQRQSAVSEVLKTISGTVFDLDPTLQTVVENAAKLADADVAWMMHSIDSKSYTWGPRYGRTPQNEALFAERRPLFARAFEIDRAGGSIVGRVYAEARTIEVSDAADDAELLRRSPTVRATKSRSLVGVPVLSEGAVTGAIILGREAVRPFSEREVQLVETFANQAAIAIRNVRLFNEIQDKSRQLEVASRHKSEFLANMSHELRTPLNAIIGFSEVLIQGLFGEFNEKQRDYLQDVIGSGQHLLSLINDILDLSKIEAGRMELELSTFSFRSALQSGVTIVRERAARNGITLNVDVSDELDQVEADERKVKQILYNLLSNAVKFTPDGGNVTVTVRRDNDDVRVDVQDNGIGIAEADQARIFEEFQQVGRERSREGTGLGLTLTKRFVELHGGRIWLESAPGQGSTFTFTLPLRQAAPVRT